MVAEAGTSGRWLRAARTAVTFAASLGQRALFVSGLPSDQRATADEHPKERAQFLFSLIRWAHA